MGEPQTTWQRIGLTRGKAVLIGLLAVALVGVLYRQFGGSTGDEVAAVSAAAQRPRRTPRAERRQAEGPAPPERPATADAPSALAAAFDPSRWQSPDLAKVVTYDPFALPASFPQPMQVGIDPRLAQGDPNAPAASTDADELAAAIERMRMELEALQQRGVQVIVRGRDKYVAIIGDRMVHVGEEINGFTVTAIEPDGVRVERNVDP